MQVCMYACMYASMNASMQVCMYVCTCLCKFLYARTRTVVGSHCTAVYTNLRNKVVFIVEGKLLLRHSRGDHVLKEVPRSLLDSLARSSAKASRHVTTVDDTNLQQLTTTMITQMNIYIMRIRIHIHIYICVYVYIYICHDNATIVPRLGFTPLLSAFCTSTVSTPHTALKRSARSESPGPKRSEESQSRSPRPMNPQGAQDSLIYEYGYIHISTSIQLSLYKYMHI